MTGAGAFVAPAGPARWRPIATAPRDGSVFLAYGRHIADSGRRGGYRQGDRWWSIVQWDVWRQPIVQWDIWRRPPPRWVFAKDGMPLADWGEPSHWQPLEPPGDHTRRGGQRFLLDRESAEDLARSIQEALAADRAATSEVRVSVVVRDPEDEATGVVGRVAPASPILREDASRERVRRELYRRCAKLAAYLGGEPDEQQQDAMELYRVSAEIAERRAPFFKETAVAAP